MSTEIPFLVRLGGMLPDRPPDPAPGKRIAALLVGVATAALVALGIYVLRPSQEPDPTPVSSPQNETQVIEVERLTPEAIPNDLPELDVHESSLDPNLGPQDVLITDTGVWVVTSLDIHLLDPTGEPVDAIPYRAEDGARLAMSGSQVWVFDGLRGLSTVSTVGVEDVAEMELTDMVGTTSALWVSRDDGSIARLDPATSTEIVAAEVGVTGDISVGGGGVWVSGHLIDGETVFVAPDGRVSIRIPRASHAIEAAGYTWVVITSADPDDEAVVAVLDTSSGETVRTFAVPRAFSLATDGEDVWIYALAPSTKEGTWSPDPDMPGEIVLIDGESLEPIGTARWGLGPVQMSARDGELWIADQSTSVVARVRA